MTNEERDALYASLNAAAKKRAEIVAAALASQAAFTALPAGRQRRAIEQLLVAFIDLIADADSAEFKTLRVESGAVGTLIVVAEAGVRDDEGTMAEVFCRERTQFWVNHRGAVRTVNDNGTVLRGARAVREITQYESLRRKKRARRFAKKLNESK